MGQQIRKTETKQQIKMALTTLMGEKLFEAITVSDITREAGINRGTFYLHYVDKFDLLDQLVSELFSQLRETLFLNEKQANYDSALLEALRYLREDLEFVSAVTNSQPDLMNQKIREFLKQLIHYIDALRRLIESNPYLPFDYAEEKFLSSISGLVLYWIRRGAKESPEELAQMLLFAEATPDQLEYFVGK